MKKIYLLFLLAVLPLVVSAQVEINGIYYNLESYNHTATVTSHSYCHYSGRIIIPANVTYNGATYKVTSIDSRAFYFEDVTSVSIGSNVKYIGSEAFYLCESLTSVTIGNSVTDIDYGAFNRCTGLKKMTIPSSVKYIGDEAFRNCSALTSVTIGKNVTYIGSRAFYDCRVLESVIIPDSVKSIGDYTFWNCRNLTSATIGESVKSIGYRAFQYCSSLETVTIPNSVYSIGDEAFIGCSSLTSVTIGNGVTYIGDSAFEGCKGIESLVIGNGVRSLGNRSFYQCSNLESLTIPNSVESIGKSAFYNCSSMTSISIGNGVTTIGEYAFWGLKELTYIISNISSPKAIDESVFYDYSVELTVPSGTKAKYQDVSGWKNFKNIVDDITLNRSKVIIKKSKAVNLEATVHPTALLDKSVAWKSSNTKVATVTSSGWVRGIKAGMATITCTSNATGAKATCEVTVGYVKLDKTELVIEKTKTATLKATVYPSLLTDKSVKWKSSNTAVATVTSRGKITGIKAGTATITCTSNATGLKTTCKVTVGYVKLDQTELVVEKTKTATLIATVYPSKLEDRSVTWESSNTKVATVTSEGEVKGIKAGTATITCTSKATGLSTTCDVTVGYVKLDKTEVDIVKGKTVTLKATVYPSKLEDKSVTWESSDTKIATVTSSGKVKGIKAGTAIITCTSVATGLSTTCKVTVTGTSSSRSLEGDDDDTTGIENLDEAPAAIEPFDVYDLSGRKVLNRVTSLDGLPDGIYIVNGKKILKKK